MDMVDISDDPWIAQVKFDHEPYYRSVIQYVAWLNEHVGEENIRWFYDDSFPSSYRIFFKSEEDKVKFILKWI